MIYRFTSQLVDPSRFFYGTKGFFWYVRDLIAYKTLSEIDSIKLIDLEPALHEHGLSHEFDPHYYYVNSWAFRRVILASSKTHVDIASQTIFSSLLSAVIPVIYLDFRKLSSKLSGLECRSGSILALPFEDNSLESISCLHVAEHVGLGRYGDELDPRGTIKSCAELERVLAPNGNLFFAVPVGAARVCFNAHRIHTAKMICEYFKELELVEYSGVDDRGNFLEHIPVDQLDTSNYSLGMFWFKKTLKSA